MRTTQPIRYLARTEKTHIKTGRCPWCGRKLEQEKTTGDCQQGGQLCYSCDEEFTE